jgi:hypothetical protein
MTNPSPAVTTHPLLPKVEVAKDGNHFRVDWDYQEAPESQILMLNEYLDGYIWGAISAFNIHEKNISCATARTGTVRRLEQNLAIRLAELLTNALHPAVATEHHRLKREANRPPSQAELN